MTISVPNSPQELLNMNLTAEQKVYLLMKKECNVIDSHKITESVLIYLKEWYHNMYEQTGEDHYLWDGCKIGTCLQVLMSTTILDMMREMDAKKDDGEG